LHFWGSNWFEAAVFKDGAGFDGAKFGDGSSFTGATFGDRARFADSVFGNWAGFSRTTFGSIAWFSGAEFGDDAMFLDAVFGDAARLEKVTFGDRAGFGRSRFGNAVVFEGTVGDGARFDGAIFGDWTRLSLLVRGTVSLEQTGFANGPELEFSAMRVLCRKTKFPDGGMLRVRWAEIVLDGADCPRPTVLAGAASPFARMDPSDDAVLGADAHRIGRSERPRVLSVRGCDLQQLVFADVDLQACRFAGAHNLDKLRLEGATDFADRPAGWHSGCAIPPLWRWTRRQTLAEEHRWRRTRRKWRGWYPRSCRAVGLTGTNRLEPAEVARLYRALRKEREDAKDAPGAADFYYGEMEMRRHDRTSPRSERFLLWLYWLVAGYALRSSRALSWLLSVLVIATVLLAAVGLQSPSPQLEPQTATITGRPPRQTIRFHPPVLRTPPAQRLPARLGTAALVAVEAAVFRTSEQQLTYKGKVIQTIVRFVGPILLALALLSLRGRVKR
jgi:hypothetical protein